MVMSREVSPKRLLTGETKDQTHDLLYTTRAQLFKTNEDSHIFSTKNNSVFVTFADICITNLCINDIVKLTML